MASRFPGHREARHDQPRNVHELRSCFCKRYLDWRGEMEVRYKETAEGYWSRILSPSPKYTSGEMGATDGGEVHVACA